jgi:hypothetical protein
MDDPGASAVSAIGEAFTDGLQPFFEGLDAVAGEDDSSARPETLLRCEDRRGDHHRTTAA